MGSDRRWDPCIAHRGDEAGSFLAQYFGGAERNTLLVAGAGFDPRACTVANHLKHVGSTMRTLLIKEERSSSTLEQSEQARANTEFLLASLTETRLESVQIFGSDGAVVGGRNVIKLLGRQPLQGVTDVVVDMSALSVGTSFPLIRYFVEMLGAGHFAANLHVLVAHDPSLDADISGMPSDTPGYVHGFKGGLTLSDSLDAARLWLPQLAPGRRGALARLQDFVAPDDICPILPFPARDPRLGDSLAEEYVTEFEVSWFVDARNIVYADEGDPLDSYRTILKLEDLRRPVFAEMGGSMLVLSPLGSKVMALGALMAALERNLPVAHLEPLGYEFTAEKRAPSTSELVHVWLEGDAYPATRPACRMEGTTIP